MARKYFKIILHRDVVGKKDFSYIDIESSGRVSTCFSKVLLSEKMKQMPGGKYKLKINFESRYLVLCAHRDDKFFTISSDCRVNHPCIELCEGDTLEACRIARMHWQHIHKETYLAMRDCYPATLEIVDERNMKRIEFYKTKDNGTKN